MASERQSTLYSQSSSFDASQEPQYRPISSGSFASSQSRPPRDLTPATSLSNPSSQEHMADKMEPPLSYPAPPFSREANVLDTRPTQAPVANMGGSQGDHTSAPKRTADGQIKQGNSISPTSPSKNSTQARSRTSSMTSRGNQIGELSNALKTRLNYAMVKVNNGWETRNISNLENHIASSQTSPISTASTLRRPYESPRPGSSSTQPDRSGFMQSSERTTATATPDYAASAPHHHTGTAGVDHAYRQPSSATQSPPSANSGRTYESFWREHSHSNHHTARPTTSSSSSTRPKAPSLAPPVDIAPRATARRTNPSSSSNHPPRLQTNTSSTNNAAAVLTNMPATPPQPKVRQSTAEDIDAIETLLFMSSPKNTGYHPSPGQGPGQMPKTPLRQHIELAVELSPAKTQAQGSRFRSGADIDRMIDEQSEGSSSDDEEPLKGGTGMDRLRA